MADFVHDHKDNLEAFQEIQQERLRQTSVGEAAAKIGIVALGTLGVLHVATAAYETVSGLQETVRSLIPG